MQHPYSFRNLATILAPAAVLAAGFLWRPTPVAARPDYTRRTKQDCRYCHPPGGWNLNDAGHYFEKNRSLNGYKPPDAPKPAENPNAAKADDGKSKSK
jgi:hypothetical protein